MAEAGVRFGSGGLAPCEDACEIRRGRVLRLVPDGFDEAELHSELVLVDPKLRARALELLPERHADSFLPLRVPLTIVAPPAPIPRPTLPMAVFAYATQSAAAAAARGVALVALIVACASLIDAFAR